jgi:ParB/RepB/Spo0J family partition protein
MTAETVRLIPLDLLDASPFNPRKTFDEKALNELAASIRANLAAGRAGITNPLIVRTHDIEGLVEERYEIVAGHRRSEAATIAGLEEVPCIVRVLDDAAARDLALTDNMQRADVPAMEEAEGLGELLSRHGSIEAVAAIVSKEASYVAKRLKLLSLTPWSRDALRAKLITIDHALLLARLGVDEQDRSLKWCLDPQAGVKLTVDKVIAERIERRKKEAGEDSHWRLAWEPQSVLRLKEHIEQSTGRKLARAPWSLDDAKLLPQAGACSGCPSNTKANTSLFGDLDIDEATCADGGCFEVKRSAFVEIALKAGKTQWGGVDKFPLRVSWKETSVEPRFEIGEPCDGPVGLNNFTRVVKRTHVLKAGQWVEAKKGSCKHVESAVTVDWSDDANRGYMGNSKKLRRPGEALLICAAPKCKAHKKAYEEAKSNNGSDHDPAAEKAKEEKRAAAKVEENKRRMSLASTALDGITTIPAEALRALVAQATPRNGDGAKTAQALLPGLDKIVKTGAINGAEFAKALAIASLDDLSTWYVPEQGRAAFIASIRRLGYKGATPWDKPKEPKAAKKAAAKAAPKKAAKKAAKR